MKINREDISWQEERPDCGFLWEIGKRYPVAVQCVIYETNFLGERRLKETKTFKLVELAMKKKNEWK